MSPDSPETRIRQLEAAVTELQAHQKDHERDIRQYAPSLIEQARLGEKLNAVIAELRVVGVSVTDLRAEMRRDVDNFNREVENLQAEIASVRKQQDVDRLDTEKHRSAREAKERDAEIARREKERDREIADRRDRVIRWLTFAALVVAAVSSTAAVIAL